MMTYLRRWLSPSETAVDPQSLREQFLARLLRFVVVVTIPLFLLVVVSTLTAGDLFLFAIACLFFAGVVFLAFARRLTYFVRAHCLLIITFAAGLLSMISTGFRIEGGLAFLAYLLLAVILFGRRQGTIALLSTLAACALIGAGMRQGWLPTQAPQGLPITTNTADWVSFGLVFSTLAAALGYGLHGIFHQITVRVEKQQAQIDALEEEKTRLRQNLTEQTALLDKRTIEQEAAGTLAFELAQETQLHVLLEQTPALIQALFGYEHVGIFLMDENDEYAVLQAANSPEGRQLVEVGYRVRRGEGIIGHVIASGQPRIANDGEQDSSSGLNPIIPGARSAVALPLKVGEQVVGALDVQTSEEAAFNLADMTVLQTAADQLGIAIHRARHFEYLANRMEELEATARQYTRQAWQSYLSTRHQAYGYDAKTGQLSDQAPLGPEAQQAIRTGQPVVQTETDPETETAVTNVAVPIKLRDQTLGVLTIQFNRPSVPDEVLGLIGAATERMALSLETARLLEEIQVRADREHIISDISAKVRSATDIDSILQTTAVELGRKLGLRDVLVQLHSPDDVIT